MLAAIAVFALDVRALQGRCWGCSFGSGALLGAAEQSRANRRSRHSPTPNERGRLRRFAWRASSPC
jgi:hypothetical protein